MPDPFEQTTGQREHGGWNRCRSCKHDGPCPCSGEACCDKFLLCGHCPEAPGHIDECCILLEYPDLLPRVERVRALHSERLRPSHPSSACYGCEDDWPCRTRRVLDGPA